MKNPDKELLEKIKARDELKSRGYRPVPCPSCRQRNSKLPDVFQCIRCNNTGWVWESPLML